MWSSGSPMRNGMAAAGGLLLLALAVLGLAAPAICPAGPLDRAGLPLEPPSRAFLAGTDDLGRDMGCLTLFGLRTSLVIGVGAGGLALALGVLIGTIAGLAGGWADLLLMRASEVMQTMPRLLLAILASALFEPDVTGLVLVLGLTSWSALARLARAEALAVSQKEFVLAAKALGLPLGTLLRRHILPNTIRPLLAISAPLIAGAILAEAALGYIGLGDPDAISLGRLIATAHPFFGVAWWMNAAPVSALVLVSFAVLLLSEADRRP
jgi:peptide/nickel transport system permease protein